MGDLAEIKSLIEGQGVALEEFKCAYDRRMGTVEKDLTALSGEIADIMKKTNRPGMANDKGTGILGGDVKSALATFVRTGDDRELKSLSAGSDPDGGYLVLDEVERSIYSVARNFSPMRRIARVKTVGMGGTFEEPISIGGTGTGWVGESDSRPETDSPNLKMFSGDLFELYSNVKVTQRLLDDSQYDVGGYVTDEIGEAFGEQEGTAFIIGNGVARPRGILSYDTSTSTDANRTWGQVQYIASGASGAFATGTDAPDVLKDQVSALKAAYRRNASWLMNSATAGTVSKLKDTTGRYLWADGLAPGQPPSLLGYPVEIDENMPDIAADSLSIAFGDFQRGYTVLDRPGVKLLQDPYSAKPLVYFYGYKRVGGGIRDFNAIKLMKFAAS